MEGEVSIQGVFVIPHYETCRLHDNERTKTCSGRLKRGKACSNRSIPSQQHGTLPMCKLHQDQIKISTFCRAPVSCGFECGRLCEWMPHQIQLCPDHLDAPMTCHFLEIPIEMRFRIYRHLLPDMPIPSRHQIHSNLRSDGVPTTLSILRTNRQIHDEAVDVLYGTQPFNIEVSYDRLSFCNERSPPRLTPCYYTPPHVVGGPGNHQLQDYQMQLMLLEQQNKRRITMARSMQIANSTGIPPPPPRIPLPPPIAPTCTTYTTAGPVWTVPLDPGYFDRINHLHITITIPAPYPPTPHLPIPPGNYPQPHIPANGIEPSSYDISDRLHALIGKLLLRPRPVSRLEITIRLSTYYTQRAGAIYCAQFLLRPFRRLSNITTPSISAIIMQDTSISPSQEISILATPWLHCQDDQNLSTFLSSWTADLKSPFPALNRSPVFDAYWKLVKMVEEINLHYRGLGKMAEMGEMVRVARVAREDGDEDAFRIVWEGVVGIWCEFLEGERQWKRGMESAIEGVFGVLGRGEGGGHTEGCGVASGSGTGEEGNGWVVG